GHGDRCGGTAGGRSVHGASWTGNGGGSVAARGASAAAGCERAGTGSATTVHELGVSDCARIFAGLHVGEPEEGAGGARRDHARSQFDASGGGTDWDHAAGSWGSDEHLRRAPGAQRLAGEAQLPGISCRDKAYLFESPADAIYASRRDQGFDTVLLDRDGGRLRDESTGFLDALARVEK